MVHTCEQYDPTLWNCLSGQLKCVTAGKRHPKQEPSLTEKRLKIVVNSSVIHSTHSLDQRRAFDIVSALLRVWLDWTMCTGLPWSGASAIAAECGIWLDHTPSACRLSAANPGDQ